jgi:hypothetical protein
MLNSNLILKNLRSFGFTIFLQNTYLHLMQHPCSAERSLGNAGSYNAVLVPKHLAMKT